jgi:phospholipase C
VPSLDRRRFLKVAGGTAAASVVLNESIDRAASLPAHRATGTLEDVEHIVVLMQENRSFDHYFGTLRGVRGFGDPHPATLPSGKSVFHQPDGPGEVLPFRPDMEDLGLVFLEDLPHGWQDTQAAINRGVYDQWIPNKSATTMAHLRRNDAPFHFALADAFTVCDAYHCSFIGNTDPNRYYMWTGWTGNDGKGGGPVLYNDEAGYDWTTYPERLQEAGVSWKVYQDIGLGLDQANYWGWTGDAYIGNYGDNSLLYFHTYQNAQPGTPLADRAKTGTNVVKSGGYFDVLREDIRTGKLPQVSWVVAPEAFSEHPNWPVNFGAWYVANVLDALTSNPEVWSKTALLITYDENDGFFDHVVPPHANSPVVPGDSTVPTDNEFYTGQYGPGSYGLGQRVPMIVVSPWSTGGWVCSETFDHTSIIRLIEQRFGVDEPQITPWRRSVCGDLTSAFDFSIQKPACPRFRTPRRTSPTTTTGIPTTTRHHRSLVRCRARSAVPAPPGPSATTSTSSSGREQPRSLRPWSTTVSSAPSSRRASSPRQRHRAATPSVPATTCRWSGRRPGLTTSPCTALMVCSADSSATGPGTRSRRRFACRARASCSPSTLRTPRSP